jgi:lipid-binding SYLF domain-containing protein
MSTKKYLKGRATAWASLISILLPVAMVATLTAPASADVTQKPVQLVDKARMTMENFTNDSMMGPFRDLIKDAKGVFIVPQLLKGAFVFGVSGGSGVLLVRDEKTREWTGPAFYTIGGASWGLQIGGEASEVILLAMTDRGVNSLMSNSLKLGGDIGLALGPVGAGVSAATANLSADILSFSRSKGLYGGISLEGAIVATRGDWNEAYFGKEVSPTDIFVRHEVTNPQAAELIEAVTRSACMDPKSGHC